jgi:hypothetical protein
MHRNCKPEQHLMAFLPHFLAHGLSVSFKKNATAPFEVYYYTPSEWAKMIDHVDMLEGCYPMEERSLEKDYGYFRTLVWMHVLPDEFKENKLFANMKGRVADDPDAFSRYDAALTRYRDSGISLGVERDLRIKPEDWAKYKQIPCWVYSSRDTNEEVESQNNSPVIWYG